MALDMMPNWGQFDSERGANKVSSGAILWHPTSRAYVQCFIIVAYF